MVKLIDLTLEDIEKLNEIVKLYEGKFTKITVVYNDYLENPVGFAIKED